VGTSEKISKVKLWGDTGLLPSARGFASIGQRGGTRFDRPYYSGPAMLHICKSTTHESLAFLQRPRRVESHFEDHKVVPYTSRFL